MPKRTLQLDYNCSVQKTARKNTKYSRNETILKVYNWIRIVLYKNPLKKKTKYPRNETILKIGHLVLLYPSYAKAIAFAKWSF